MVGLPATRRGSLALVTRPCTVVPIGITVFPSITTASVTLAENGSPAVLLDVASVFSSFILRAVPVGKEVCATARVANIARANTKLIFLILQSTFRKSPTRYRLTLLSRASWSTHDGESKAPYSRALIPTSLNLSPILNSRCLPPLSVHPLTELDRADFLPGKSTVRFRRDQSPTLPGAQYSKHPFQTCDTTRKPS